MDKKKLTFDFSGWATKNDVKCSDGRTIRKDAFKHNDGQTVPLVWNHMHQSEENILGNALLENREQGVYAYCSFNNTEQGKCAKELVKHGDICSLSIYANQLKQQGGDVIHGAIREVSLVLAGANPEALIEQILAHSNAQPDDAILIHSQLDEEPEKFEFDVEKEVIEHAEEKKDEPSDKEETVEEVIATMNEKQQNVMYALTEASYQQGLEDAKAENNEEDNKEMKQNAFETTTENTNENVLTHSELLGAIDLAKKNGSLKDAVAQVIADKEATLQHSITNIGELFPNSQNLPGAPKTINDDTSWVAKVKNGVGHTPFSRVKMRNIDITGENARARGYVKKGQQKVEEVIAAMKRETTPQTIYKLQKLDRDDIIDITDFDVVAYIKDEMRGKLDEEWCRAVLTGDGRADDSDYKINPLHIRPILGDSSTYVVAKHIEKGAMTDSQFAKDFIKQVIKARKDYKGSGNPTLFTTQDMLTEMLLIEDKNERVIYDTIEKLKTALMVSDIVTPPYFEGVTRTKDGYDYKLIGILVNLRDYNIGCDKGGQVAMFDDFDINFNKYEYLIETRISGAMVQPYGAITFEQKSAHTE